MDDSNTKDGWQADSKSPSRTRTTIRPPKLVQAAVQAKTVPQQTMLKPKYLPRGTLDKPESVFFKLSLPGRAAADVASAHLAMIQFCGYSTIRMVM